MKYVVLIVCAILLIGCNAIIGIPTNQHEQPWRYIYLFSVLSILIMPLLSGAALIYSIRQSSNFKLMIEKYLNYSVIVIVLLWLLAEMSLPPRANIRLDLFVIIPAIGLQLVTVIIGVIIGNKAEKNSSKYPNRDK